MCTPFVVFSRARCRFGSESLVSFVQLSGAFDSFADHMEAVKDKRRRVERSLSTWKHPGLRRCMQRWLEYMNIVAEERMEEAQEMTRKLMHEAQGVPPLHTLPALASLRQYMRKKTMTRFCASLFCSRAHAQHGRATEVRGSAMQKTGSCRGRLAHRNVQTYHQAHASASPFLCLE